MSPRLEYDAFISEADEDSRKVMMVLLRQLIGEGAPFDDRELWNGIRELIHVGFLNVYFRFDKDGVAIQPEFLIPPENDNARPRGAA